MGVWEYGGMGEKTVWVYRSTGVWEERQYGSAGVKGMGEKEPWYLSLLLINPSPITHHSVTHYLFPSTHHPSLPYSLPVVPVLITHYSVTHYPSAC